MESKQVSLMRMGLGMGSFKTGLEEYIAACVDSEAIAQLREVQSAVIAAEERLIAILSRADAMVAH